MTNKEDYIRKERRRRARIRAYLHSTVVVLLILVAGFSAGCLVGQAMQKDPVLPVVTVQIVPAEEAEAVQEPEAAEPEPESAERDLEPVTETVDLGKFKVTHYCPCEQCCNEWADGITYTGTTATEGRTIAVDPDVIPLGSTVVIDGHEYIAEDIGGAIQGNRIDVFMDSHEAALVEGIKTATVSLVKEVSV